MDGLGKGGAIIAVIIALMLEDNENNLSSSKYLWMVLVVS